MKWMCVCLRACEPMTLDGYMQLEFTENSSDECGERKLRADVKEQHIF